MNPLPFILLAISLPLLLGGCGEKPVADVKPEEPVAETKPELEGVNSDELEERDGIAYLKGSDTPYTGKYFQLYENGQKKVKVNYKDGKQDGLRQAWHENGQKKREANYKDGKEDGLHVGWHENGQKASEGNYKDDKGDGLYVNWHGNGQKKYEGNFKDGEIVSAKYWNSKGEEVDSYKEASK